MRLINDTKSRYKYYLFVSYITDTEINFVFKIENLFGILYTEFLTVYGEGKEDIFNYLLSKNTVSKISINYAESTLEQDENFYEFATKLDVNIFRNNRNTNFLI